MKYTRWPGGEKVLVCFHGFGQDNHAYKTIHESLKETFTVYSFDLFFHGDSQWSSDKESLETLDWFNFFKAFLNKECIEFFEVMGFSMGAKFAMVTAELFPDRVSHLHLLAPDGIKTHFSNRLFTYPYMLRRLFKNQIENPVLFNWLVSFSKKTGLLNNYSYRFAKSQMDTESKRRQVYFSWVVFRNFNPDLKNLAQIVNSSSMNITFYLGNHDKVIGQNQIAPLLRLLHDFQLKEIDSGHSQLIVNVASVIKPS